MVKTRSMNQSMDTSVSSTAESEYTSNMSAETGEDDEKMTEDSDESQDCSTSLEDEDFNYKILQLLNVELMALEEIGTQIKISKHSMDLTNNCADCIDVLEHLIFSKNDPADSDDGEDVNSTMSGIIDNATFDIMHEPETSEEDSSFDDDDDDDDDDLY